MKQIGNTGSEGRTYLLKIDNREYAYKKFKNKSIDNIKKEAYFQKIASIRNISPKVYKIDDTGIIMEKMDTNLIDYLKETNGELSIELQNRIIYIIDVLDELEIFHNDPNPCNFMFKKDQLFIIDYGYSKLIDNKLIKKYKTKNINKKFMILGFIFRMEQLFKKN